MGLRELAAATGLWIRRGGEPPEAELGAPDLRNGNRQRNVRNRTRAHTHTHVHSHGPGSGSAILISTLILFSACIYSVVSETQWVWSQNRQPHSAGISSGSLGGGGGGSNTIFPESPPRPSSSSNDALPPGTIRIVNTMGEARLIPGASKFVSDAINNLVDRVPGGGGSAGGSGGGSGAGGLLSLGSGFISSIPQLAGSVLGLLFNRNPSAGSNNNNNNGGTGNSEPTQTIQPFPVIGGGNSGGTTFPANPIGGSSGGGGGGGNCKCIPLNQCFLPSRPSGDCAGGNSNCCATSQSTRAISADDLLINGVRLGGTRTLTPTDVRVGLLENIVRGSSTVLDDALDLVLHPWLTQEDQQKIASRIGNNGRKR